MSKSRTFADGTPVELGVFAQDADGRYYAVLSTCYFLNRFTGENVFESNVPAEELNPVDIRDRFGLSLYCGREVYTEFSSKKYCITGIRPNGNILIHAEDSNGDILPEKLSYHPFVKDALGKLIDVGDTVYTNGDFSGDGSKWTVDRIVADKKHCLICFDENRNYRDLRPEWVTHKKHHNADSAERIANDCSFEFQETACCYFLKAGKSNGKCNSCIVKTDPSFRGYSCSTAMKMHIKQRINALTDKQNTMF